MDMKVTAQMKEKQARDEAVKASAKAAKERKEKKDKDRLEKQVGDGENNLVYEEEDNGNYLEEGLFDNSNDEDFVDPEPENKTQNRMTLTNLARECMRWGVSPKAGASIAAAVLVDAGKINKDDKQNIIDKNKLKRQMKKYQENIRKKRNGRVEIKSTRGYLF